MEAVAGVVRPVRGLTPCLSVMLMQDEKARVEHENRYIEGYTARRMKVFHEFLTTEEGKRELRLVAANLAGVSESSCLGRTSADHTPPVLR